MHKLNAAAKMYLFFMTLPERLYPFASEVGGQLVRGKRSYERAVARALEAHGFDRLGYKLVLYRGTFHFFGSVVFIVLATLVSKELFGSERALYVLLIAAVAALSFQEFYLHPKWYAQPVGKGVLDWLTWVVPIAAYFFFFK